MLKPEIHRERGVGVEGVARRACVVFHDAPMLTDPSGSEEAPDPEEAPVPAAPAAGPVPNRHDVLFINSTTFAPTASRQSRVGPATAIGSRR